jgi:hypothetical protein
MKATLVLAAVICCAATAAFAAGGAMVEGTIRKFECGDNCYLTIVDASGKERTGLCVARQCREWNDKAAMPRAMIGRKVRIVTGVGKQYDSEGVVRGRMTSFEKIDFQP